MHFITLFGDRRDTAYLLDISGILIKVSITSEK